MTDSLTVDLPNFSDIDIKSVEAQLEKYITDCEAVIDTVANIENPTWGSFVQPQEESHNALSNFWSPISHLNSVMNTPELRDVYNACIPKISAFYTRIGQNVALYDATQRLRASDHFKSLNKAQQKSIENDLLGFQLSGVSLDTKKKKQYSKLADKMATTTSKFSDNVLDATNAWEKIITDKTELKGLPESALAAASQRAKQKEHEGYHLNLEFPTVYAVMTFCENRELRKEVYIANGTRASEIGPQAGQFDNTDLMQDILCMRAEMASLVGYKNYADYSVVRKMVESPKQVTDFLNDLATRAVPAAKEELKQLEEFAKEQLGLDSVEAWDLAFVAERLKQKLYDISDEDLKPYFPATKAIPGMFEVVSKLFGLKIKQASNVDLYHDDVSCYEIKDLSGELRGMFYLDNYAREQKRGGAWMDVCRSRQRIGSNIQIPVAYLTCNLTPPVGDDPALLTHNEVTTLFHEFGHGLHHMLTRIDEGGVSGISGVEWDAVELPSQFLENWCWERESLDMISGHYQSGKKLPDELLDKLKAAKNFQTAMQLVRQLEFSLIDMQLHMESSADKCADIAATVEEVRTRVAVIDYPEQNRFINSFSHIFAGGYAAGYFSYKWAEVLSADAFSRFEEEGIFNTDTGKLFLQEILEKGGSRDAMESFTAFRGREPKVDALLRHTGLAA